MGGEAAHGALSDHIAEPAFWRCVKSCVNLGLIYVLWLPLPSGLRCLSLPSAAPLSSALPSANGDMRFKSNHGDLIHLLDLSLQESKLRHT